MKMLVIADDFTGANDTGVQLAKKGARTDVLLRDGSAYNRHADVIVVNTDSRACDALTAANRVSKAIAGLLSAMDAPLIYKKIDSTFRGNVGAEIAAAMQAVHARIAIVAAAIPAAGRVTLNGHCLVNQIPVHQTEFASDPKTPVATSRIADLLAQQAGLKVQELYLEQVRSPDLDQTLKLLAKDEPTLVVVDAVTEEDLQAVAQAAVRLDCRYVLAGAAGLANALPCSAYLTARAKLPMLIVAGSMSEATRRQVACVSQQENLRIVDIEVQALLGSEPHRQVDELAGIAARILHQRQHCVLRTCRDERDREQINTLCEQWQLTRQALGEIISQRLAELTLAILDRAQVGSLFLTGGDIAIAVARILNAQGYRIAGEIAPCIPWGTFTQSDIDDLPVITKAGGFGSENILREAICYIEEMYSEAK
ncbi:D-threonate kinase [Erwinia sp. BNK-24-b]|uniref:D-threonate kinase n=1 Tax=unclassified Erwinia TaxID=2622719 RepID=UPI0039BF5DA2